MPTSCKHKSKEASAHITALCTKCGDIVREKDGRLQTLTPREWELLPNETRSQLILKVVKTSREK